MIRAVVFDMDGVVIDSERHWRRAERDYLTEHIRQPLDATKLVGLSMEGFHEALVRDYGLRMDLAEFIRLYRDMARDIYERRTALMPGFADLLDALRGDRLSVGLASSSPDEWVNLVLARFALRFDAVADADDVGGVGKPHPAVYLAACKALSLDPGECVAIEDSRNGIAAAKAAGMACVGLRNGFNAEQEFSAADLEVSSLTELTPKRLRGLVVCSS
ncbi:MAG: HAD family phosphatase [Elusimicrobia bacterium]|nr:HAD family phosphatase [Elusimicrobiota bacterium]